MPCSLSFCAARIQRGGLFKGRRRWPIGFNCCQGWMARRGAVWRGDCAGATGLVLVCLCGPHWRDQPTAEPRLGGGLDWGSRVGAAEPVGLMWRARQLGCDYCWPALASMALALLARSGKELAFPRIFARRLSTFGPCRQVRSAGAREPR